jgi:alpha-1,3-mannosyltransferase
MTLVWAAAAVFVWCAGASAAPRRRSSPPPAFLSLWTVGSLLYSLGVGVKMNALLLAPGVLALYLRAGGPRFALLQIAVCAAVQLAAAAPFLLANPWAYLAGAFNLGRAFEPAWSVNWRWLPDSIFGSPAFSVALLVVHAAGLAAVVAGPGLGGGGVGVTSQQARAEAAAPAPVTPTVRADVGSQRARSRRATTSPSPSPLTPRRRAPSAASVASTSLLGSPREPIIQTGSAAAEDEAGTAAAYSAEGEDGRTEEGALSMAASASAAHTLWAANFIGVACARSLHFQFLPWYWHSLPLLLGGGGGGGGLGLPLPLRAALPLLVELAWNRHPPDAVSSLLLTAVHFLIAGMLACEALWPDAWMRGVERVVVAVGVCVGVAVGGRDGGSRAAPTAKGA